MKISTLMSYAHGFRGATQEVVELEKAGLDVVGCQKPTLSMRSARWAIRSENRSCHYRSGILNIYSRTPALMAMTAAGLDEISEGNSCSDLARWPASHRGLHGVPYDAPMTRLREVVEICRKVWLREEKLNFDGKKYHAATR